MEGLYPLEPVTAGRKVIVAGGGPGGMVAAVTAAARGLDVEIWEESSELGGSLLAGGAPSFKRDVLRLRDHLVTQIEKLGIVVRLSRAARAADIAAARPDAVIVATGSIATEPPFDGAEGALGAIEVLTGAALTGDRVLVAGGGIVGCETALFLAEQGKQVTVVDPAGILVEAFVINKASLLEKLSRLEVGTLPGSAITGLVEGGARVSCDGDEAIIECDTVVIALGSAPDRALAEELSAVEGLELRVIGDAVKPRKVLEAVWEGFHAARLL
jgi:2-enoate reductase